MLEAIGLDRSQVYIANVGPWRPPGNRTPTPVETQICLPFIQRQIELADPDILVTVGQPSTAALLGVQGIAPGLSPALADRQAPRLAGPARDQSSARVALTPTPQT
jgi:uracil-DNA glycosylase family 4